MQKDEIAAVEETANAHGGQSVRGELNREADLLRPGSKEGDQSGGCTHAVEG